MAYSLSGFHSATPGKLALPEEARKNLLQYFHTFAAGNLCFVGCRGSSPKSSSSRYWMPLESVFPS